MNDVVVKPTSQVKGEISPRSQWNHNGKTQLVSALEKVDIQVETLEMPRSKTGSSRTNEKMTEDTAKLERKIPVCCLIEVVFFPVEFACVTLINRFLFCFKGRLGCWCFGQTKYGRHEDIVERFHGIKGFYDRNKSWSNCCQES